MSGDAVAGGGCGRGGVDVTDDGDDGRGEDGG